MPSPFSSPCPRRLARAASLAAVLACGLLAACSSGEIGSGASDLGASVRGGFVRSNDTNGTQRRMDVNNIATRPVTPTISNR